MTTINPSPYIGSFCTMVNVNSRFASYDFCYGYFQQNKGRLSNNMEHSCYVLFSYLASWGMLRGSSPLLQYSPAVLTELITHFDSIKVKDSPIWNLDVPDYTHADNIQIIINERNEIRNILTSILNTAVGGTISLADNEGINTSGNTKTKKYVPTDTLVTKIMLGVFGVVPAFDRYFQQAFHTLYPKTSFNKFSKESLNAILSFYHSNKPILDSITIPVIYFSGKPISLNYKVAKLIDMFGFMYGRELSKVNHSTITNTSRP